MYSNVISADLHIIEPGDLWLERLDRSPSTAELLLRENVARVYGLDLAEISNPSSLIADRI
jgi:hypothetical protein